MENCESIQSTGSINPHSQQLKSDVLRIGQVLKINGAASGSTGSNGSTSNGSTKPVDNNKNDVPMNAKITTMIQEGKS